MASLYEPHSRLRPASAVSCASLRACCKWRRTRRTCSSRKSITSTPARMAPSTWCVQPLCACVPLVGSMHRWKRNVAACVRSCRRLLSTGVRTTCSTMTRYSHASCPNWRAKPGGLASWSPLFGRWGTWPTSARRWVPHRGSRASRCSPPHVLTTCIVCCHRAATASRAPDERGGGVVAGAQGAP